MPIYEYACLNCGEKFEWLVRGDEKASCPSCGRRKLKKQFSVPAAHVGGSSQSACPAREDGSCGVSDCGTGCCGLNRRQ